MAGRRTRQNTRQQKSQKLQEDTRAMDCDILQNDNVQHHDVSEDSENNNVHYDVSEDSEDNNVQHHDVSADSENDNVHHDVSADSENNNVHHDVSEDSDNHFEPGTQELEQPNCNNNKEEENIINDGVIKRLKKNVFKNLKILYGVKEAKHINYMLSKYEVKKMKKKDVKKRKPTAYNVHLGLVMTSLKGNAHLSKTDKMQIVKTTWEEKKKRNN